MHIAEIEENQRRISVLNQNKQQLTQKKTASNEASGELSNQITEIEGEIALTTTLLNTLRSEMRLWEAVLVACSEIKIQLIYANEKKSVVMECFERLFKVQDWLFRQQTTDQYIRNCLCKGNKLMLGEVLKQNEYLLSQNKRFIALMQTDNNFVVYHSQGPMWASNTYDAQGVGFMELDKNGLFSLQGTNRAWNAKRSGAVNLMMQDDGNLVTYDKDHQPLWATDTYTYANIPGICFSNNETT